METFWPAPIFDHIDNLQSELSPLSYLFFCYIQAQNAKSDI